MIPSELSSEEKFAVVIESASLNEVELSKYCRRKGLYPEQIQAWRKTCMQANASVAIKVDQTQVRAQAKQLKQLEAELRRKDKALAETAALLVLQIYQCTGKLPRPCHGAAPSAGGGSDGMANACKTGKASPATQTREATHAQETGGEKASATS